MPLIETERLLIENAELTDSSFIFKLLNSPTWLQFIGDRGIATLKDAERYIQESLNKSYEQKGYGLYKITLSSNHSSIGLCGFLKRDYLESVDLGFALLPEFEGKGFAFEAAKAIMIFGWEELKLSPILAITSKENKRSQKLLGKLGFNKKGVLTIENESKETLLFST